MGNSWRNKRDVKKILLPLLGIGIGLLFGALIIALQGVNPVYAYYYLLYGAIGNTQNLTSSLLKTIPLGMVGLAVIFSYKAGIFNIGGEGQFYLGAIGATIIGTMPLEIPAALHILLCILAAVLFGGIFAILPGYLKAYKGFNEIVITMLLNYVALLFASYLLQGPMQEPGTFFNRSSLLVDTALLPSAVPDSRLHFGIYIFFALAVALFLLYRFTTLGFRFENVGMNRRAAGYAGDNTKFLMLLSMVISGGIAGSAGAIEVMGVNGRLIENFISGVGYDGIAIALLANLNPLMSVLAAFFFGALRNGANSMQIATGVSSSFVYIIQAMAVLSVITIPGIPRVIRKIRRKRLNRYAS